MSTRMSNNGESEGMRKYHGNKSRLGTGGSALAFIALAFLVALAGAPTMLAATVPAGSFAPRLTPLVEANPPLPPLGTFPVQLVLDDGSRDGDFGFAGPPARNFLWFNQFSVPASGFVLEEIWVLFAPGPNMVVGGPLQLAVYLDPDGDPSNGATLLATVNETIQVLDGDTFSIYTLAAPISIAAAGDVLIGVVMRDGVTPPPAPAAIDTAMSAGRSWVGVWSTEPPDPPLLAPPASPDNLLDVIDNVGPDGNWMIRGFGTTQPAVVIPTLDTLGLVAMFLLLAGAALFVLRRLRGGAGAISSLLLLAVLSAAPAFGVVVDDFSTAQALLTAPPDADSSVAGAGILGGTRDLAISRLSGTATTSVAVAAGQVSFIAGLDTRGQAVATWDADSDPATLDPVGLGGVDLTAGGATSFRLQVEGATAGVELGIEVYTDGANSSFTAFVLPAIGAQQDLFLAFAGFLPDLGGGADFTNVGAIVMTLRDTGTNLAASQLDISLIETVGPTIAATKVDALLSPAPAEPGDAIEYTIEIDNTSGDATAVALQDLVAANPDLSLVAGSVRSTPIARPDQYEACGNVLISVDGSPGLPGLLGNDSDPDGNNGNPLTITAFDATTVKGGTVSMVDLNTGSFDYEPPPGFTGVDQFTYTIEDDDANARTTTATLVIGETVWFVDNTHGGPFLGTQPNPFNMLAQAEAASGPGDTIYIREGDGTTTGYDAGITLQADQRLIGQGVDLVACGTTLEVATGRPRVTHTGGNGIDLTASHEIRGLNVVTSAGAGIFGSNVGTVTVSEVSVIDAGGAALDVDTGDLAMTFDTLDSLNSGSHGVRLHNVTGTLTAGTTQIDDPTDFGISILNSPAAIFSFGTTAITTAGDVGAGPDAGVVVMSNAGGTVRFASLSVSTENGPGILAANGGTLDVQATGGTVSAAGGAALDLDGTTLVTGATPGWTFASLSSTGSPTHGVRLNALTDPVTATTSTLVQNPDTVGIVVSNSGGTAFDFGATTVQDTNVGAGATANGIDLTTGNAAATFTFDSLALTTDGGFGLRANGSGTINVGGAGNTISASGGAALDVTSTSLGGGATFASLGSTGATTGINLSSATGAVTVTGATTVGATGPGVNLASSGAFSTNTLAVTTTAGTGLVTNNTGTVTVTTAAGSQLVATGGPAVSVTNTNLAASLATMSSTGSSATGASFIGANGSWTANAGSVTGSAGTAFHVGGGSPAITYGGSVTQNNAQRVVNIEDTTGGSVTFPTGTVSGGASSLGVRIHNADGNSSFADLNLGTSGSPMTNQALTLTGGSTGTHSFAGTQIFTSGARGVHADNGGNVEFTGTGNRVTTTTGRALTFENGTTIGPNGVIFERIDASGSDHGIRLASAGSGFTVTGLGTTDGTGGTIQTMTERGVEAISTNSISLSNMTFTNAATTNGPGPCPDAISAGANTGCHAPIHLEQVVTATLINVDITGSAQHGLNGWRVTGLTLNNSTIVNAGNEAGENGAKLFNLFGTSTIDGTTINNSFRDNLRVQNDDNTQLNLTIDNSFFTNSAGGHGVHLSGRGSSRMALVLEDSEVTGNGASGIQPQGSDDTTASGGSFDFRIRRTVFENNAAAAIDMGAVGQSPLYFEIMDNGTAIRPILNHGSHVINVNQGGNTVAPFTTATVDGIISGNFVGSGPNNTGTTAGSAIRLVENQAGTMRVRISGNTVKGWTEYGIFVIARDAPGNSGSSNVDVTIQGNTANDENGGFPVAGIGVQGGAANLPAELHDICVTMGEDTLASQRNTVTVGGFPVGGIQLRQRFNTTMSLYQGGSASMTPATVLTDNNTITATPATAVTGTVPVVTTACALPVTPP